MLANHEQNTAACLKFGSPKNVFDRPEIFGWLRYYL